ncbi:MAG: radical SAM protein [Lachnospiraceae bacterium]|nr:radical SAM protein [Lachnospiraceae bacterium]
MAERTSCLFGSRGNEKRAFIEITGLCNMLCKHCMNDSGERRFRGLEVSKIKKLLEELVEKDFKRLYVSGGEPLLYDGIDEVLDYAKELGIKVTLATNGWEVKNHVPAIVNNVDIVSISLDGIGRTHDNLRGILGAYERTIEALQILTERGVNTKVSTMIWSGNVNELEEIAETVYKIGVKKLNFSILVPVGRVTENKEILVKKNEYYNIYKRIDKLVSKYKDKMVVEIKRQKGVSKECVSCPGADMILHIDAQGKIAPCSWVSKIECDGFSRHWDVGELGNCIDTMNNFKKILKSRVKEYEYTGCPAMAYIHNGHYLAEDPINKMITNEG